MVNEPAEPSPDAGRPNRWLPWSALAALVVLPAIGVAVLVGQSLAPSPELVVEAAAVVLEPTLTTSDGAQRGSLLVTTDFGDTLVSSGGTGLVTDVLVEPGTDVVDGTALFALDGVTVRAARTDHPFYRDLSVGVRGPDVRELEAFLSKRGHFEGKPDTEFTAEASRAVRALEKSDRAEPTGVFRPETVVFLPRPLTVGDLRIDRGVALPGAGKAVLVGIPIPTSGRMVDGAGTVLQGTGTYILSVEGTDVGRIENLADVSLDVVAKALSAGQPEVLPPEADAVAGPPTLVVDAALRWVEEVTRTSVPSAAVMTDSSGESLCVWTPDAAAAGGYAARTVEAVGGSIGSTDVNADIAGIGILANPAAILAAPQCP